jgi:hypothetical protein
MMGAEEDAMEGAEPSPSRPEDPPAAPSFLVAGPAMDAGDGSLDLDAEDEAGSDDKIIAQELTEIDISSSGDTDVEEHIKQAQKDQEGPKSARYAAVIRFIRPVTAPNISIGYSRVFLNG